MCFRRAQFRPDDQDYTADPRKGNLNVSWWSMKSLLDPTGPHSGVSRGSTRFCNVRAPGYNKKHTHTHTRWARVHSQNTNHNSGFEAGAEVCSVLPRAQRGDGSYARNAQNQIVRGKKKNFGFWVNHHRLRNLSCVIRSTTFAPVATYFVSAMTPSPLRSRPTA